MLPMHQWAAGKENNFLQFTVMSLEENDAVLSPLFLCMSLSFFSLQKAGSDDEFLSRSHW